MEKKIRVIHPSDGGKQKRSVYADPDLKHVSGCELGGVLDANSKRVLRLMVECELCTRFLIEKKMDVKDRSTSGSRPE